MRINKDSAHLLIVDDDTRIRNLLQKYLIAQGYFVSIVKDTSEADRLLEEIQCDLIVLDLMMPGENGVDFAKRLRARQNNIPIIMLTAMGEFDDRIKGLEVGADDYVVKPFEPRELLLRIANILKYSKKNAGTYNFSNLTYNLKNCSLFKNNVFIALTNREHKLLSYLIMHANHLVSRGILAEELEINERSVDVQIVRLRNKIEDNPSRPQLLQTIRGEGYILRI